MLEEAMLRARLLAFRPATPVIIALYKLIFLLSFRVTRLRPCVRRVQAPGSRARVSHQRLWTPEMSVSATGIGPTISVGEAPVMSTSLTTPVLVTEEETVLPSAAAAVTLSL